MSVDTWRDYLVRRGLVVGLAGSSGVEFICGARRLRYAVYVLIVYIII